MNGLKSRKEAKNRIAQNGVEVTIGLYGKVPPQALDVEKAILGAIMLEKNAFDVASEIVKAECFYAEQHQLIFSAMRSLSHGGKPIDMITICEELRMSETLDLVGGPYYITKLTQDVVSSANIEFHCRLVLEKFMLREMIRISGQTITSSYEDKADIFEVLEDYDKAMTALTTGSLTKNYTALSSEIVKRIARIEELRHKQDYVTGIPSGFGDIDRVTHGWQPTDLIILAARPSVGKTCFALNLARNAALHPTKSVPVGFFSLEMSAPQLTDRLMSSETGIWLEKITNGSLSDDEMITLYSSKINELSNSKIFIDDTPAIDLYQLKSKCRNLKRKHNVGLIVIDYLQLMSGASDKRSGNREQEISTISRGLKAISKELKIPIIALSQLSRAPETRKGEAKMPVLSDLRESGAIEQDADMVIFMYRPEYYGEKTGEFGESTSGETHVRIAKHRNGSLETIKLRALLHIQKFTEFDESENTFHKSSTDPAKGWVPVKSMDEGKLF